MHTSLDTSELNIAHFMAAELQNADIPKLNSMERCNTVPSGVQIKHTEISSQIRPIVTFIPLRM